MKTYDNSGMLNSYDSKHECRQIIKKWDFQIINIDVCYRGLHLPLCGITLNLSTGFIHG